MSALGAVAGQDAPQQNLLNNPESVVFDQLRCRYLVSNWGDGNIVSIDSLGNQAFFLTSLTTGCLFLTVVFPVNHCLQSALLTLPYL